jgi:hypothetical protein
MTANLSRYDTAPVFAFGKSYGTSYTSAVISNGIKDGSIRYTENYLQAGERIDVLAGQAYGDGRLYWIICAASGVGFASQVPPGTVIKIPILADVVKYLSNNRL